MLRCLPEQAREAPPRLNNHYPPLLLCHLVPSTKKKPRGEMPGFARALLVATLLAKRAVAQDPPDLCVVDNVDFVSFALSIRRSAVPECARLGDIIANAARLLQSGGATATNVIHYALEPNATHSNMPDFCACFAADVNPADLYLTLDGVFQRENCELATPHVHLAVSTGRRSPCRDGCRRRVGGLGRMANPTALFLLLKTPQAGCPTKTANRPTAL